MGLAWQDRMHGLKLFCVVLRLSLGALLGANHSPAAAVAALGCHLGTKNCNFQMERYVHTRRQDGIYVINLEKTWEKLQMAARIIVAVENPQDVVVLSARPYGQRAVRRGLWPSGIAQHNRQLACSVG